MVDAPHGDVPDYAERNREAWNEVVPIHKRGRQGDLDREVQDPSFNALDEVAQRIFARMGLSGKTVAHLCCNIGIELISVLRMGAASGVGFDIADAAIAEATRLAALADAPCAFFRTNVLDIPHSYDDAFDIVFFTVGALTWIQDLDPLFAVCFRLLRVGGYLVIHELHPFTDMMATTDDQEYDPADELRIVFPYFGTEPWVSESGLDYVGGTTYQSKPSYAFPHTLSATLSAIAHQGLAILDFWELPQDIATTCHHLEKYGKVPLSYALVAKKLGAIVSY